MGLTIAVHGGAGAQRPDGQGQALAEGCLRAAREGYAVMARGGSALDAVEQAVAVLENDPRFNAGCGSALNAAGEVEMDAALMEGASLRAGAVAGVRDVPNPVRLARAVMERTPHVLLAGVGAAALADELGLPRCDPQSLITPAALERLRQGDELLSARSGGTVGAVAQDAAGRLAAATSTGGISGKRPGRIGDSPLIGCGTYADSGSGAASATGLGEAIIRVVLCKFACDQVRPGRSAAEVAPAAVRELERVGGRGGLILLDARGGLGLAFNTAAMSRAWIHPTLGEGCAHGP